MESVLAERTNRRDHIFVSSCASNMGLTCYISERKGPTMAGMWCLLLAKRFTCASVG